MKLKIESHEYEALATGNRANPSHVIKTDGAYGRRVPPYTVKCYGHADDSVVSLARRYYEKEHGGRVAVIRTADGRVLYQTKTNNGRTT